MGTKDNAAKLALEEKRYQMTLEALAEIDAGKVVPHAVVQAWADSLDPKPLAKPKRKNR